MAVRVPVPFPSRRSARWAHRSLAAALLACAGPVCAWAAQPADANAPAAARDANPVDAAVERRAGEPQRRAGEPQVRHVVVEDDAARIEELRVRGVTRRIHVQPKAPGSAGYEILPPDASQQADDGTAGTRGARGQRVWNVLSF